MSRTVSMDPARAGLPLDCWPPRDRLAWQQAKASIRGPFRIDRGGFQHRPETLLKSEKGLRRWLGFLQRAGQLDGHELPCERLTPERLDDYFAHLLACGNSDRSVFGRFEELQLAFELMFPGQDFKWLTKPNGTPLHHQLQMRRRNRFVPGAVEVLAWADELFREGIGIADRQVRPAQVRDALMIAILVTRAPRLRALSSFLLGTHLQRRGGEWVLDQQTPITKEGNMLLLPLSPEIGAMVDRYVAVERAELLHGRTHDAVWVSGYGTPLGKTTISGQIWRRTLRRFGVGFGPHRFRDVITTTLALENPAAPFDASLILGHGSQVSLASYNRATGVAASRRHQDGIKQLRRETEALARRAFRDDRDVW